MQVLINFADEKYKRTQSFNSWTGKMIGGFDKVLNFSIKDINSDFLEENKDIFTHSRGCGLWLWKPYLIDKVLNTLNDGDILFYSDSGAFFVNSITPLIKEMGTSDIWLYGLPLIEKQYSKPLTFDLMGCTEKDYFETNQFSGTFMLFRVGVTSRAFVREWLDCCLIDNILTPEDGIPGSTFLSHREDQSVLSLLAKKHGIPQHKDPSQYGKLPEKYNAPDRLYSPIQTEYPYRTILIHHRTSNVKISVCIKQLLLGFLPRKIGLALIEK